jgi:hypothetical protein
VVIQLHYALQSIALGIVDILAHLMHEYWLFSNRILLVFCWRVGDSGITTR